MVSFTITEKGYALKNPAGEYFPAYVEDFKDGPGKGRMLFSRLTELLYKRYKEIGTPIALCSMDNCSHNGEKVEMAVKTIASEWRKNGFVVKSAEIGFIVAWRENPDEPELAVVLPTLHLKRESSEAKQALLDL